MNVALKTTLLLAEAAEEGVDFTLDGDNLAIFIPHTTPQKLQDQLKAHEDMVKARVEYDAEHHGYGVLNELWFLTYLIACLLIGGIIDRFNPKLIVLIGSGVTVLTGALQLIIVVLDQRGVCPISPVLAFIVLSSISGFFTSLFWPPLMGWISTGYEGPQLNRRLGLFSSSWAFGRIVSPYFAGLLIEHNSSSPMILILLLSVLSLVAIVFAKTTNSSTLNNSDTPLVPDDVMPALLPKFMWMARIALFTACVCVGLARTHLAVLFKFELPFTESVYGAAVLIMSISTFAVFLLAGQSHAWHYKLWLFISCQILTAVSMLLILFRHHWLF